MTKKNASVYIKLLRLFLLHTKADRYNTVWGSIEGLVKAWACVSNS